MCDLCVKYSRSSDTEKDEMRQRMEEHLKNKTVCREQEKPRAQSDSKVNVACFDLQQVLITPHSMSSQRSLKLQKEACHLQFNSV